MPSILSAKSWLNGLKNCKQKPYKKEMNRLIPHFEQLEDRITPIAQPVTGLYYAGLGKGTTSFNYQKVTVQYNNEFGLYRVDDATGSLNGVSPSDTANYLTQFISSSTRTVLFAQGTASGTNTTATLEPGRYYAFFIVQNASYATWASQNPDNDLPGTPNIFFSLATLNPDSCDHFRRTDLGNTQVKYEVEDLDNLGDQDWNDIIATITPPSSSPPPLVQKSNCDCPPTGSLPQTASGVGAAAAAGAFAFSSNPVRYADGTIKLAWNDLASDGFGTSWGQTRNWTNGPGYASGVYNGSGMVVSEMPHLLSVGTSIAVVLSGTDALYFDWDVGTSTYKPLYFNQDKLTYNAGIYKLVDTTGHQFTFYDFGGSLPTAQRGQLVSVTDQAGNVLQTTYDGTTGKLLEATQTQTVGGSTYDESYLYSYVTGTGGNVGLISNVTLRRRVNGGSWTTVRQVNYAYYSDGNANGSTGDLKSAAILDGSGATIDTMFYRYYTSDSATGYKHALKFVFGPASYARLTAAGLDAQTSTDSQVDDYADFYLEYDLFNRVSKEVVQGEGCSVCTGGQGTYTFTYTASGFAPGYNRWNMRTEETLPDGSKNIVYTNAYGQVMLKSFKDVSGSEWRSFFKYDDAGRVELQADQVAITGCDDSYSDLLHSVSNNYQYLDDSNGQIVVSSYYASTSANDTTAGGVAGYIEKSQIKKGETGAAITQNAFQYFAHTDGGVTVNPIASVSEYRTTGDSLDPGFGANGKAGTTIGSSTDAGRDVAVYGTQYVVAGYTWNGSNYDWALARYNNDGTLDTAFGTNGIVTTTFGSGDEYARSVVVSGTQIIVAGYAWNGTNYDIAVARYNSNGSLDTSFDSDGKVTTAIGAGDDFGTGVALSGSQIVVGGYSLNGSNYDFAALRYNSNGSLDTAFDTDGKVTTAIGSGDDIANAVTMDGSKIVLAGQSSNGTDDDFAMIRYNSNGTLDTSFSGDGKLTTAFGSSNDRGYGLVLASSSFTVVGSTWNGSSWDFAIARYNLSGVLDTSLDSDGKLTTSFGSGDDQAYDVAFENNQLIVAGSSSGDFALARYDWGGALDATFDADGKATTGIDVGSTDTAYGIALLPGSQVIVAGQGGSNSDFALARYFYRTVSTTNYSYMWYSNSTQMRSMKETLPVVLASQNGPGTTETTTVLFDTYGRPTWYQDADGYLSFFSYDPATGALVKTITDVDTSMTSDFGTLPADFQGLRATYHDNSDLSGGTVTRFDSTVNFNWVAGSPDPSIGADTFSGRWTGKIKPLYSETYTFYTTDDDGVRLWVNGQLVVDAWVTGTDTHSGTIALTAGQSYDIVLEFFENGGNAQIKLEWQSTSQAREVVPASRVYVPGLHLITTMEVDALGRSTKLTQPGGNISYTVYNDAKHEVRSYVGWNGTTGTATGPTTVLREVREGSFFETLTMSATPQTTGSSPNLKPTGGEAIGNVESLSRTFVSAGGQVYQTDSYFNLSGITDNFNRSDSDSLGGSWVEQVGDSDIASNQFIGNSSVSLATNTATLGADVSVQASVALSGSQTAGLVARWAGSGDQNMYVGQLVGNAGSFTAKISKNVSGTWTDLKTVGLSGTATGTLRFEVQGDQLRLFWNDVLLLSVTDTSITAAGKAGIRTNAGVSVDNFDAHNLSANRNLLSYDQRGRLERVLTPTGTITRTTYDTLGRVVSSLVGTNDTGTSYNMLPVSAAVYDLGGVGDSNLTQSVQYLAPFLDNFNRTDSDSLGGNWVEQVGDLDILSSQLIGNSSVSLTTYSGSVEADVSVQAYVSLSGSQAAGLVARYAGTGDQNMYVGQLVGSGGTFTAKISKNISGTWTDLASVTLTISAAGMLRFEVIGNALRLYLNDRILLTAKDTSLTAAGTVGVRTNSGVSVDNFAVMTSARKGEFFYDWRNRLVAAKGGVEASESTSVQRPITYYEYDNLDRVFATEYYDSDNVTITDGNSDGVPDKPSMSLRRARNVTHFDEQGSAYQSEVFSVNQSNGTLSTYTLKTDVWYDHRGNVMKQVAPGAGTTKMVYDGAGRLAKTYVSDGGGDSNWGHADDVVTDKVAWQQAVQYDANSNPILSITKERFDNLSSGTLTGELGDPSTMPYARVSYLASYYDAGDRLTDLVNVGTNGGSAYTRPSSPDARSDTVLRTSYGYNSAGQMEDVTDPRGIISRTLYDDLGRTIKTIQAYVDGTPSNNDDRTTEYSYDGNSNLLTVKAWSSASTSQTTQYVYGVTTGTGSEFNSNDILAETRYPDPSTGAASATDKEVSTFNAVGQVKTFTDRNGSVHTYSYDELGRPISDVATTLGTNVDGQGTNVDGSIRRIETAYDTAGRAYLFTSYDATSGGNIVNQVLREFNGLGQMTKEYQEHNGAVTAPLGSQNVQYAYSEMSGGANHSRLTTITYPNGRYFTYEYTGGSDGSLNDSLSRTYRILDNGTTVMEAYAFMGLGTVVQRARPYNGSSLLFMKLAGESNGDAGDQYTGLDRFGRIAEIRWRKDDGASLDRIKYGYDRDGNRLYADNQDNNNFDELFHANGASNGYDSLNQLQEYRRGALSDANSDGIPDTVTTASRSQSWALTAQGNFSSVTTGGVSQTRTHNEQNEITSISGLTTPVFDKNGNMTKDETGRTFEYDAWNRLIRVKNSGGTTLITYAYDAMNRRISENPGTTRDFYYSASWQVLEERVSGTARVQYLWAPMYVDALILRDRDSDNNGSLDQRHFVQQDANWNVTSIVSSGASVQERYAYDAYGTFTIYDGSWTSRGSSSYAWVHNFQGLRHEGLSGLDYARNRDYSATLMRWVANDPIGFGGGQTNLYAFIGNGPVGATDPYGLDRYVMPGLIHGYLIVDSWYRDKDGKWKVGSRVRFDFSMDYEAHSRVPWFPDEGIFIANLVCCASCGGYGKVWEGEERPLDLWPHSVEGAVVYPSTAAEDNALIRTLTQQSRGGAPRYSVLFNNCHQWAHHMAEKGERGHAYYEGRRFPIRLRIEPLTTLRGSPYPQEHRLWLFNPYPDNIDTTSSGNVDPYSADYRQWLNNPYQYNNTTDDQRMWLFYNPYDTSNR